MRVLNIARNVWPKSRPLSAKIAITLANHTQIRCRYCSSSRNSEETVTSFLALKRHLGLHRWPTCRHQISATCLRSSNNLFSTTWWRIWEVKWRKWAKWRGKEVWTPLYKWVVILKDYQRRSRSPPLRSPIRNCLLSSRYRVFRGLGFQLSCWRRIRITGASGFGQSRKN